MQRHAEALCKARLLCSGLPQHPAGLFSRGEASAETTGSNGGGGREAHSAIPEAAASAPSARRPHETGAGNNGGGDYHSAGSSGSPAEVGHPARAKHYQVVGYQTFACSGPSVSIPSLRGCYNMLSRAVRVSCTSRLHGASQAASDVIQCVYGESASRLHMSCCFNLS